MRRPSTNEKGCQFWHLFKDGAEPFQLIFNEEGHDMSEVHHFFLAIGKASYAFSLYQWLAMVGHMMKNIGCIAYEGNWLAEL